MKQTLVLLAVLSSMAAFADSVSTKSSVFGILRVDSTAANTIVSVPWVATGSADGSVSVSNVIKTANLTKGDFVFKMNNGVKATDLAWELDQNGEGVLYWKSVTIVTENGVEKTTPATDVPVARGDALMLCRKNHTGPFYLYGQVAASKATSVDVARAADATSYNLFAPPSDQDVNLLAGTISTPVAGDQIVVKLANSASKTYTYKDSAWKTVGYTPGSGFGETTVDTITVPAGLGFWYVAKGAGTTTITWPSAAIPSAN